MPRVRAVVFDVDGVLTTIDSIWRFIHDHLGTWGKAKVYAEMYKRGEIDYAEWAQLDVSLWRGVPRETIEAIVAKVPIREGAREVIDFLRSRDVRTAAISAGLDVITDRVSRELGLDLAVSNRLVFRDSKVTGEVEVLVGYGDKGRVFIDICRELGVRPEETAAVGDSDVDVDMLQRAGFAVAFNPRSDTVVRVAHVVVRSDSLVPLLEIFRPLVEAQPVQAGH